MNKLLYLLLIAIAFSSCNSSNKDNIDLSKINVKIEIKRFDKALFSVKPDSLREAIPYLSAEYSDFFNLFGERIIGIGKVEDQEYVNYLESFVTDKMVSETYRKVQQVFPNLDALNADFTNAFKRFHFYFPNRCIPKVYSFVSGFNQSTVLADGLLGIGLDRYLGSDYENYPRLGIPKYSIKNMNPSKISSDCMRAWAIGEFPFNDSIDNLASNMIYEGKLMYFTNKMLPDQPDSLIFGYTPLQMKWCEKNEKQIWTYLIENKMLFITDSFVINKCINDAPFTSGFPQESPGRAIVWLGYKIVGAYLKNNKDISFQEMMLERDYHKILNNSRYRP
ncbi:MAG TPA: hypothetical protein DIW31_05115 [Bacteroidales bacterium]|nr:hypothetical protein [Bacteroidales bacterium]